MNTKPLIYILIIFIFFSCVPSKRYKEILLQQQDCDKELERFKSLAIDNKAKNKDLSEKLNSLNNQNSNLVKENLKLKDNYNELLGEYNTTLDSYNNIEKRHSKLKRTGQIEKSKLQNDLETKIIEVQRKEDVLSELEKELADKEYLLEEREKKLKEVQETLTKQKLAREALLQKINLALNGFKDKGLSVIEKNGKIYVSLEAKLLFSSGSTMVDHQGKKAITELAKTLEGNDSLEIIVEGHTDVDKLESSNHPKNNWELSVLRATSIVNLMVKNSNVTPKIISASGRSEFHPIDINDKAKNRRIEIIISPNLSPLFKIIHTKR